MAKDNIFLPGQVQSQEIGTNVKQEMQKAGAEGRSRLAAGARSWLKGKKTSVYGGSTTKTGRALRLFGQGKAADFWDAMFGFPEEKKQQQRRTTDRSDSKLERKAEQASSAMVKSFEQISGTLNIMSQTLNVVQASVLDMKRGMGNISDDVTDIKRLIMPKDIVVRAEKGSDYTGKQIQFGQYNPLAPKGLEFMQQHRIETPNGRGKRGNLTGKELEPAFIQSAIKQAAMETAILTTKIRKKDEEKAKLEKANLYTDPKERKMFSADPMLALREHMDDQFARVFAMLKGITGGDGDGMGIPGVPIPGGRGGAGAGGRGRKPKGGKGGKPPKGGRPPRTGRGGRGLRGRGRGGSILGVGALIGGYLGYKAVDSFREMTDEEHINPALMQEDVEYAVKEGDVETLRKNREQIAKQKKDVKLQATASGTAVAGAAAGNVAGKKLWKLFVNFVKRKAPKLAAKLGARLAAAGAMATVPVLGWIGTAMTIGFSAWMAWDLYQLWKEFKGLSEAEQAAYSDEAVKLDEKKDDASAKGPESADTLTPPPANVVDTRTRGMDSKTTTSSSPKGGSNRGQLRHRTRGMSGRPGEGARIAGRTYMNAAMDEAGIEGADRAALLAQVHHESNGFSRLEENLNYSAERLLQVFPKYYKNLKEAEKDAGNPEAIANRVYGGRLGNAGGKDGWKYRGRGFIQLTGKDNYKRFGDMIGVDLVGNPDLAKDPTIAAKIAVAYYKNRVIDKGIDAGDVGAVTKAVQGGSLGLEERANLTAMYAGEIGPPTRMGRTHSGSAIDMESRDLAYSSSSAATVAALQPVVMNNTRVIDKSAPPISAYSLSGMSDDPSILNMADSNHALS